MADGDEEEGGKRKNKNMPLKHQGSKLHKSVISGI